MLTRSVLCVVVALLLATTSTTQNSTMGSSDSASTSQHATGVRGRVVVDPLEHVPIRNAFVLAHRNFGRDAGPDGSKDVHVLTDASGQYAIPLPLGVYDVFISAVEFSPTSRKIQVTQDGMMIFDAVLEVNTLGLEKAVH